MAIDENDLRESRAKIATWAEQGRDQDRLYDLGEYIDFERWGGTLDSCTIKLEPAS